jgi:hypothetical protein
MVNLPTPTTTSPFSVLDKLETQGNLPIGPSLQTLQSLEAGLAVPIPPIPPAPESCQAKSDNKVEINQEDTLVVNTKRINELTQQIRFVTDCDALKLIVKQHLDDLKKQAEKAVKDQLKLMQQYLPITSLPSPTPFGIVKWLGKLLTGTVIPMLEAFIKYTVEILQLIKAVTDLVRAVQEAMPRLRACAVDIRRMVKQDIKNEIERGAQNLKNEIFEKINSAICDTPSPPSLGESLIKTAGYAMTAYNLVDDTLQAADQLKTTLEGNANDSLSQISQMQTQMQGITGIAPAIATDSLESFQASVDSGAFETYKAQNQAFIEITPPLNDEAPVASGFAIVGNTVTCNTGVWTSNAEMTYSAQWYREGNPIYNANSFTYSPAIDDIDLKIYCQVVGENKAGYIEVKSNELGPVVYSVPAANLPVISGSLSVGSTLQCSTGTWAGFTPTKYDYQWFRGTDMVSSANSSYVVASGDSGNQIKCKVIASSARYTLAIDSDPVSIP